MSVLAEPDRGSIAFLRDGDSTYFRECAQRLKEELAALSGGERVPTLLEGPEWSAEWDLGRARTILQTALRDPKVDVVCASGTVMAEAILEHAAPWPKPVVLGLVFQRAGFDLPTQRDGGSAVSNFTYVVASGGLEEDLAVFHELVGFRQLTVLVDRYVLDCSSLPVPSAEAFARERGIVLEWAPLGATAEETLESLPRETQAVYLMPSVVMEESDMRKLIEGLTARRVPTFSGRGISDAEQGALAAQRGEASSRLIRRWALNLHQILRGAAPETLPVRVEVPMRLVLNGRTLRALGLDVPYRLMVNADLLYAEEAERGWRLDLATAMNRALTGNPALAAARETVATAREERNAARSALFPQLDAQLQYVEVDKDRAVASMGLQPQRTTLGGVSLTQAIFHDPALTAFRAQSLAWKSRQFEVAANELDTLEATGLAYIQLLSQRAILQIELGNLRQIQRYVDLAADRERAGVAAPEEIFRWKAQLAAARSSAMEAYAQVAQAQAQLNEVMGEEMDTLWDPVEGEELIRMNPMLDPAFAESIRSDREFEALREFLLEKVRENAPELKALDLGIRAQELIADQHRRRSLVPEVGVSFQYDHTFDRAGAPTALPDDEEDNTWMIAATARWPLFEGGRALAAARQARAEVRRLKALRRQVEQHWARRLHEAMASASSSHAAIRHAQEAVELARRNLEGVQQRYASGKAAIVDLLDAQTEVFVQERRVALAKYQYLASVIQVERAIAWFPERDDAEGRARWISAWEKRRGGRTEEPP